MFFFFFSFFGAKCFLVMDNGVCAFIYSDGKIISLTIR